MQPMEVMLLAEISHIGHELRTTKPAQARQVQEAELRHQRRRRAIRESRAGLFRFLSLRPRRA